MTFEHPIRKYSQRYYLCFVSLWRLEKTDDLWHLFISIHGGKLLFCRGEWELSITSTCLLSIECLRRTKKHLCALSVGPGILVNVIVWHTPNKLEMNHLCWFGEFNVLTHSISLLANWSYFGKQLRTFLSIFFFFFNGLWFFCFFFYLELNSLIVTKHFPVNSKNKPAEMLVMYKFWIRSEVDCVHLKCQKRFSVQLPSRKSLQDNWKQLKRVEFCTFTKFSSITSYII